MNFYRETIKNAPSFIAIPKEMRNRDVELIILPLDETENSEAEVERDANGYPIGFLKKHSAVCPIFPTVNRNPFSLIERKSNEFSAEISA